MSYQLVFQWQVPDLPDFNELLALEEAMIESVRGHAHVDGHDSGALESNIFVETNDPEVCFQVVMSALGAMPWFASVSAGYRRLDNDVYTVLWPQSLEAFAVS